VLVADQQSVDQDILIEIRAGGSGVSGAAEDLRRLDVCLLEKSRLFRLEGVSGHLHPEQLAVLIDPLVETASFVNLSPSPALPCGPVLPEPDSHEAGEPDSHERGEPDPHERGWPGGHPQGVPLQSSGGEGVDVFCRPGVTDAEGEMAALALGYAGLPTVHCHAGHRYRFAGRIPLEARSAVERALGNPLIHSFVWSDEAAAADRHAAGPDGELVSSIELRHAGGDALLAMSRQLSLALDLPEMQAIAAYFDGLGRDPSDVELQSLALTWSEHCSHKTFKAAIDFEHDGRREHIRGLLRTYLATPTEQLNRPWVRSAFVDNAGVIAFDPQYDLAFKVETHNHPSALEPYGGAHTGVGGVIRDVLGVSAEPIANTDVLCFGPLDLPEDAVPDGAFHPRTTYRGVVQGISDYGNNMGIPTVGGAVLFHSGYTANPLVYCGTLGLAPRGRHPNRPRPGDAVVLLGGRTGRDGLHGATMSSASLDREIVASSTVQIGNPITEKILRDVLPLLRDEGLYNAITDCGAGGLCSAVGEMGADLGVEVDLALVPLKYSGLKPWEIWLSEAQERMVLAVPPGSLSRVIELCCAYDLEASLLGSFRDDGRLQLRHGDLPVADIEMSFLHGGRPARTLRARWNTPDPLPYPAAEAPDPAGALLQLLAHPNIASKEEVIRRYDHEVGAATVVKPLVGRAGPSDAAVLRPLSRSRRGVVVAHGINPLYGELDPHAMAMLAVDEALRNLIAVGGSIDRAALLDNFCWGDVDDPEELGALVRAVQGCRDAALVYGAPFISGKDSLRNTSADGADRRSIPGTLLISAVGVVPDARLHVTMDLKSAASSIYVLGQTRDELGGSHYLNSRGIKGGQIPRVRPDETPTLMRRLTRAIRSGLVLSCHDLSEGGLAVAAAEMSIAGGLAMHLDLDRIPTDMHTEILLFSESPGRFLVEVAPEHRAAFERLFAGLPCAQIGKTATNDHFVIRSSGETLIDLRLEALDRAFHPSPPNPTAGHGGTGLQGGPGEGEGQAPLLPSSVGRSLRGQLWAGGEGCRTMVLAAAGVNCDRETVEACRLAGARVELVHLNQLLGGRRRLQDFGMLVLPGGFSYGDHLGAGAMLATILRYRLLGDLHRFIAGGRPVLGICNGFQVLARLGLLGDLTLVSNDSGRFECRWVRLRVESSPCVFLQGLETLELPIAHGQGRVVVPDGEEPAVRAPLRYVENPNGSMGDIAGVCNEAGNVFGLMPHPERYLDRYHHPSRGAGGEDALPPPGLVLFQNAVRYVREAL